MSDRIENHINAAKRASDIAKNSDNPKLLLTAIEHLYLACNIALNKTTQKTTSKNAFKETITQLQKHHNLSQAEIMQELHTIITEHKNSPMVFKRKGQLIICDKDYNKTILSEKNTKERINKAKIFIKTLSSKELE